LIKQIPQRQHQLHINDAQAPGAAKFPRARGLGSARARLTLFASLRVTWLPGPPLPCSSLRRPPSDACRLHMQCCPPRLLRSRREVSPLLRVACAHVACCALPVLAFSLCAFPGGCLAIHLPPTTQHTTATAPHTPRMLKCMRLSQVIGTPAILPVCAAPKQPRDKIVCTVMRLASHTLRSQRPRR
jgi:hypothetical protein